MTEYNRTQTDYRERCKSRIQRQLEISKYFLDLWIFLTISLSREKNDLKKLQIFLFSIEDFINFVEPSSELGSLSQWNFWSFLISWQFCFPIKLLNYLLVKKIDVFTFWFNYAEMLVFFGVELNNKHVCIFWQFKFL